VQPITVGPAPFRVDERFPSRSASRPTATAGKNHADLEMASTMNR
jgi:hypothetical protein